jgi:leucyl aminopeptidase (aminopeptidase T)
MSTIAAVARRVADAIPTARHVVLVRDRCGRAEVVDAVIAELHARGLETVVEHVSNARLRDIVAGTDAEALAGWDAERAQDTARVEAVISLGGWPADLSGLPPESVTAWTAAVARVETELESRRVPMVFVAVPTIATAQALDIDLDDLDRNVFDAIAISAAELVAATAPVVAILEAADELELVTGSGVATVRRGGRPLLVDDGVVDADDIAAGAVVSNLPAGSVYWTVLEDHTRGSVGVAAGSVLHFGDDGRVVDGPFAGERVGHLGIATNPLITSDIGWTLVDEHRAGAVFVSLGENRYMGGSNASAVNVDLVAESGVVRPPRSCATVAG